MDKAIKRKGNRWHNYQVVARVANASWKSFFDGKNTVSLVWGEYFHVQARASIVHTNNLLVSKTSVSSWKETRHHRLKSDVLYHRHDIATKIAHIGFEEYLRNVFRIRLRYGIQIVCGQNVDVSYRASQVVGKKVETSWHLKENPPWIVQETKWKDRSYVCKWAKIRWNCAAPVSVQRQVTWNAQQVHIKCAVVWNIISTVAIKSEVVYNVNATVGRNELLLWNARKFLWALRSSRYKVYKVAQFVELQRGIHRPNEFRGALLSNSTIAQIDRKRRIKLGIK